MKLLLLPSELYMSPLTSCPQTPSAYVTLSANKSILYQIALHDVQAHHYVNIYVGSWINEHYVLIAMAAYGQ